MSWHQRPTVPEVLVGQISDALAAVDEARAELARVVAADAPLRDRRAAYAALGHAFDEADALLREAVALARQRSYRVWGLWRHRLSSLDTARQVHLFAGQDDVGLLPLGSVRAIDTGMSGPDLGDLQHGMSRVSGSPPTYGLDVEALLTVRSEFGPTAAEVRTQVPA